MNPDPNANQNVNSADAPPPPSNFPSTAEPVMNPQTPGVVPPPPPSPPVMDSMPTTPEPASAPPVYEQGTPTITTNSGGGRKKILIIGGIVVLLLVLGIGGYLLARTFLAPTTSEETPVASPIVEEITAMCVNIKAYDEEWNRLTIEDLPSLQPGDVVRFSVAGDTSNGSFDMARFSVNSVSLGETNTVRPGTDEFYDEYIIPEDVSSFSVEAQLHHSTLDQWI